jgi:hypothetical protein
LIDCAWVGVGVVVVVDERANEYLGVCPPSQQRAPAQDRMTEHVARVTFEARKGGELQQRNFPRENRHAPPLAILGPTLDCLQHARDGQEPNF